MLGFLFVIETSHASAARIPRGITALDILCLALLAILLRSLLGDGYRIFIPPELRISLNSWERVAFGLVVLLGIRHAWWRVVPWHVRVGGWLRAVWRAEPVAAVFPAFLVSRLVVLAVGYTAVATIGHPNPQRWPAHDSVVLDMYGMWDAGWYFRIATEGYAGSFNPARQSPIAFFPGLPLLMRAAVALLDINYRTAAAVVVTIAFFWALTYVYRLARETLTADQSRAAVIFLSFYPFAVSYSAGLTESVFLLAAAGAIHHFRSMELLKAGAFALLAGLVRPNGFLLCAPLGLLALIPYARGRGWLPGSPPASDSPKTTALVQQLAVATLPVVGMLLYAWHVRMLTGDPFAWMKAQQAWGRGSIAGFHAAAERWELITSKGLSAYVSGYPVEIFEAAAAFFALAAVVPIIRRFGLAYGVFVAMAVLPPLVTMGPVSLGRYTAPLFPIFLWLGASVAEQRRPYWIGVFAAGQALVAVLFFTSRPPY